MEIIQEIWTALNTENETIINMLSFPMTLIEATVTTLLFTSILNIESTRKQRIIYILLFSFIAIISIYAIPSPYNTFVNLISCPLLVYFIFKTSFIKSILSEIVPYIASVILIAFLPNLYAIIFNTVSSNILIIPIHKCCYSLLHYTFLYIFYIFCKHFGFNINIKQNLKAKKNILLLLNFFVGIIALAIQSLITTKFTTSLPYALRSSSIFILLIYFIISILSLSRTSKLEDATENLEEEKLYNKTLTILYDNIRGFRHNFNNIIQALGGYIDTNNIDGLKNYYNDLLKDSQKSNNLSVLNPQLINNPAIYSILTSKYYEADKNKINMNLEVFMDLQTLNIKTYDLTIILGILLDNAIEAAKQCDDKAINVIIRKDNKVNRQLIIIENTYQDKGIDIDRIFEKGYTTKNDDSKDNHGLGLWNVRKILKKNNNLNLYTSKDNRFFKQQLEIYF